MPTLVWHDAGAKTYETGLDRGVLYPIATDTGVYGNGIAWNGLVAVSEKPSGGEVTKKYADNTVYAALRSVEEFKASIEAYAYPKEFEACDGSAEIAVGVVANQQTRAPFGLCYRTQVGNDLQGIDYGYKIHLVYGASANPSERSHQTINESPDAITFSWELDTVPIDMGPGFKPSAKLTIDSTKVAPAKLAEIEALLYGTVALPAALPLPAAIVALIAAVG